jgi:uncharacterized protein
MEKNKFIFPSFVLGIAIIISVVILSGVFYKIKTFDNVITTTGSTKKLVMSDQARWNITINNEIFQSKLKNGYKTMDFNLEKVLGFLKENGVLESEISVMPVNMREEWQTDKEKAINNNDKKFNLNQIINIFSEDVEKITQISQEISSIIDNDLLLQVSAPEYLYSKLADERVNLLKDAIKDAQARASQIVKNSGRKIGFIKSASNGVVQVLSRNSNNISNYGTYNTSSIEKEIMITVKATFVLK